jgi:hypothetical protein
VTWSPTIKMVLSDRNSPPIITASGAEHELRAMIFLVVFCFRSTIPYTLISSIRILCFIGYLETLHQNTIKIYFYYSHTISISVPHFYNCADCVVSAHNAYRYFVPYVAASS